MSKEIIKDKTMLNVTDEVYNMDAGGTFASPDGAVRRHIPVICKIALNSGEKVAEISIIGTSVATANTNRVTCDGPNAVAPSPTRGRRDSSRKKPDILSAMMLYMKDDKECRVHESQQKSADRLGMVKMAGDNTKGYFSSEKRKHAKKGGVNKRGRDVRGGQRNLG